MPALDTGPRPTGGDGSASDGWVGRGPHRAITGAGSLVDLRDLRPRDPCLGPSDVRLRRREREVTVTRLDRDDKGLVLLTGALGDPFTRHRAPHRPLMPASGSVPGPRAMSVPSQCVRCIFSARSGLPELACLGQDRSHQVVVGRQVRIQRLEDQAHRFGQRA